MVSQWVGVGRVIGLGADDCTVDGGEAKVLKRG